MCPGCNTYLVRCSEQVWGGRESITVSKQPKEAKAQQNAGHGAVVPWGLLMCRVPRLVALVKQAR